MWIKKKGASDLISVVLTVFPTKSSFTENFHRFCKKNEKSILSLMAWLQLQMQTLIRFLKSARKTKKSSFESSMWIFPKNQILQLILDKNWTSWLFEKNFKVWPLFFGFSLRENDHNFGISSSWKFFRFFVGYLWFRYFEEKEINAKNKKLQPQWLKFFWNSV